MSESDSQRIAREAGVPGDHPWLDGCGCWTCTSERVNAADGHGFFMPMCVCAECGNKRCPKATRQDLPCSGSNEPGQEGSRYAGPPTARAAHLAHTERPEGEES